MADFAFFSEDLDKFGLLRTEQADFISFTNAKVSTLNVGIHPIFAKDNWSDMSFPVWHMQVMLEPARFNFRREDRLAPRFIRRLEPALKLASTLMHFSIPWFAKLLYGQRYTLPGNAQVEYLGDVDLSYKVRDDTRKYLRDLGKNFRFFWGCEGPNSEKMIILRLSNEDYEILTDRFSDMDVMQQQRWLWRVALTLVHEVCHAVGMAMASAQTWQNRSITPEPYVFRDDPQRENGRSWEMWMFGAMPVTIDSCKDAEHGFTCVRWGYGTYHDRAMNMRTVSRMFSQAVWDHAQLATGFDFSHIEIELSQNCRARINCIRNSDMFRKTYENVLQTCSNRIAAEGDTRGGFPYYNNYIERRLPCRWQPNEIAMPFQF